MISSSGRGASAGHGEISECPHCHRRTLGTCMLLTKGCFRCGSTDHLIAQCPLGDNRSQQGSGRGRYVAPPSTHDRVEVKVARFNIEDEEALYQRLWIVRCLQHQHEHMP